MSREYGLCLWTFGDISVEEKCKLAKDIGVDGVEVQGDLTQDPGELANILSRYGLKVLSVTPDNVDISCENEDIRLEAVGYFLNLLDWASDIGAKRICLHGDVGKITGSGDLAKDWVLLVESSRVVMKKAEALNIEVVFEVLNRYENHQIITNQEALKLLDSVNSPNLSILLDAYHMNIEEADPIDALRKAGSKLGVYHVADSNRQAVGNGHSNIKGQVEALHEINYTGPIIMEMTAEGPNPFTAVKGPDYLQVLTDYYKTSLEKLKVWDTSKVEI
ncbi:sugar phosphate isomerase/epimerase [Bacillus sp. ISL-40]|uniref:sugar phosphate isomerase/epimerase family protein n=1 Tax=unclassified Bacillus (in: firmicutes) TaxID=185979 RepID=UPI001BE64AFD|nr:MULTISPECIES: sugar phosphate isomerase/epimerase family protein [unclassified Bacillus (in: firmicutes)]MBT2701091.1 sugar phosphate isomerase/epimerase [Bacillus sp. ISL-40]MBT2723351.1 sugar phosphate isomerase/epimerase [Bacillus sp. ISL-46]MBT2741057.1 sugar phosphate isomerase/epimerase [Bacillus sp. ISL-77]